MNEALIKNQLNTIHILAEDLLAFSDALKSTWREKCREFHFGSHGVAIANLCTHLQEILDKEEEPEDKSKLSYEVRLRE